MLKLNQCISSYLHRNYSVKLINVFDNSILSIYCWNFYSRCSMPLWILGSISCRRENVYFSYMGFWCVGENNLDTEVTSIYLELTNLSITCDSTILVLWGFERSVRKDSNSHGILFANDTGAWGMNFVFSSPFSVLLPLFWKFSYKSFLFQNVHIHSFCFLWQYQ